MRDQPKGVTTLYQLTGLLLLTKVLFQANTKMLHCSTTYAEPYIILTPPDPRTEIDALEDNKTPNQDWNLLVVPAVGRSYEIDDDEVSDEFPTTKSASQPDFSLPQSSELFKDDDGPPEFDEFFKDWFATKKVINDH